MWRTERGGSGVAPFFDCASNLLIGARFARGLEVAPLTGSVCTLLERHDLLRSTFQEIDDEPCRVVGPVTGEACRVVDLSDLPPREGADAVRRMLEDEVEKPIDLTAGPLFRALVIQTSDGAHVFVCVVHHLVFDNWSRRVLARELKSLYEAHVSGRVRELPAPAVTHRNYVEWQRSRFSDAAIEAAAADMVARLKDAGGRARPEPRAGGVETGIETRAFHIDAAQTAAIRLCRGAKQ